MWSAKKEHKIENNLNSEKKGLWLQAQPLFRSISKTDEKTQSAKSDANRGLVGCRSGAVGSQSGISRGLVGCQSGASLGWSGASRWLVGTSQGFVGGQVGASRGIADGPQFFQQIQLFHRCFGIRGQLNPLKRIQLTADSKTSVKKLNLLKKLWSASLDQLDAKRMLVSQIYEQDSYRNVRALKKKKRSSVFEIDRKRCCACSHRPFFSLFRFFSILCSFFALHISNLLFILI